MKRAIFVSAPGACVMILRSVGLGLIIVALSNAVQATPTTPEIDAGSLASGLTLLTSGILIITNSIRRK